MLCYSDYRCIKGTNKSIVQWDAAVAEDAISKMPPTYSAYGIFGFGVLHGLLLAMIEQRTIKVHITLHVVLLQPSYILWHDGSCHSQ